MEQSVAAVLNSFEEDSIPKVLRRIVAKTQEIRGKFSGMNQITVNSTAGVEEIVRHGCKVKEFRVCFCVYSGEGAQPAIHTEYLNWIKPFEGLCTDEGFIDEAAIREQYKQFYPEK